MSHVVSKHLHISRTLVTKIPYLVDENVENGDSDEANEESGGVDVHVPLLERTPKVEVIQYALRIEVELPVDQQAVSVRDGHVLNVHIPVQGEATLKERGVGNVHGLQVGRVHVCHAQVGSDQHTIVGQRKVPDDVHAMGHGRDDPEGERRDDQAEDDGPRALYIEDVQERVADAEVTVKSYGCHDEGRVRYCGRDEKHVQLAEDVVGKVVADRLEDDGVGDSHQAGDEVRACQSQDEDDRGTGVTASEEDVESDGVADHADDTEEGQHDKQRDLLRVIQCRG